MNLVIHDLTEAGWRKISAAYEGCAVVSDDGNILPCSGCFGCWNRTPGQCVLPDGYGNMGSLIHRAQEVTVISRYTYGGFSGFVKNVFDRSLGYVLPQFEVIRNETHHRKRYPEEKPFTFIFYGNDLSDEEKESARRYVSAVCANIRGKVKDVIFQEGEEQQIRESSPVRSRSEKVILLNASMRCRDGNSAVFAGNLAGKLKKEAETVNLKDYRDDLSGLARRLEAADAVVLCTPLYVDGLPSQLIRLMEEFGNNCSGKIYVLANMGLYEVSQLENLFEAVRQWCRKTGLTYCGGLGISAGELLGTLMKTVPFPVLFTKRAEEGAAELAEAVSRGEKTENIFAGPYLFPRSLYIAVANAGWNRTARANGISPKSLYRRL